MSREITITLTDEAYLFLQARARQASECLTVEDFAKTAIAAYMYESLVLEKKFAVARAAVALIDGT